MLQRIQTLFLILALALSGAVYFVPFWTIKGYIAPEKKENVTTLHITGMYTIVKNSMPSFQNFDEQTPVKWVVRFLINPLLILGLLISVFLFSNRKLQMRVTRYSLAFVILQFLYYVVYLRYRYAIWNKVFNRDISSMVFEDMNPQFGILISVASVLCIWLALSRMIKDEKLTADSSPVGMDSQRLR